MTESGTDGTPQRWPLRGFARTSFVLSSVILVLLLVVGLGLVGLVVAGSSSPGLLVPAGVLVAVAVVIGSQMQRCATYVALHRDGTLVCLRPVGSLRTHVTRVRRTSRSVVNYSGRHTPTVLHTADGSVLLTHGPDAVAEMIAAIDRHRPGVSGERGA
ncbi:hypothetical protein [Pseudonocardia xishanensis]|uniref:PH (Pleckstrin Homology) domain-containing protein n=1 Tax=Pseudonocardia xishanensis TaxID=630995 RepID=A0ABP8RUV2_9PSEU